ncbi:HTH-like domain-containing protein [Roseobacteraceae bacterium S113]
MKIIPHNTRPLRMRQPEAVRHGHRPFFEPRHAYIAGHKYGLTQDKEREGSPEENKLSIGRTYPCLYGTRGCQNSTTFVPEAYHRLNVKDEEMSINQVIAEIEDAIKDAPRNAFVAELHLQVIKHSDALQSVTGREFCETLGIGPSFGTEFAKMKKIAPRLKAAGLDVTKL